MSFLFDKYKAEIEAEKPKPITLNTFSEYGQGRSYSESLMDKYRPPVTYEVFERVVQTHSSVKSAFKAIQDVEISDKVARAFFKEFGDNGNATTYQAFTAYYNSIKPEAPQKKVAPAKPVRAKKVVEPAPTPTTEPTRTPEPARTPEPTPELMKKEKGGCVMFWMNTVIDTSLVKNKLGDWSNINHKEIPEHILGVGIKLFRETYITSDRIKSYNALIWDEKTSKNIVISEKYYLDVIAEITKYILKKQEEELKHCIAHGFTDVSKKVLETQPAIQKLLSIPSNLPAPTPEPERTPEPTPTPEPARTPEPTRTSDPDTRKLRDSLREGVMILMSGKKANGENYTYNELIGIESSVKRGIEKIGSEKGIWSSGEKEKWDKVKEKALKREKTTPKPPETEEVAETVSLPISEITTDEKRFQPRERLNEKNITQIVENYNPIKFNPVHVWKNEDGKIVLIAGHHRLEAMKRMGRKTIPTIFFHGSARQAEDFAAVDNVSRTRQFPHENAKFLRRLRIDRGLSETEIKTECIKLYHVECSSAWFLSFLSETGHALQEMSVFNPESDDGKIVSTLAVWTGKIKEQYPHLTNSQENEIYKFAKDNYGKLGKQFTSYTKFKDFVLPILDRKFFGDSTDTTPINFNNIKVKSNSEHELDARILDAHKEMKKAESAFQGKVMELEKKKESGVHVSQSLIDSVLGKYQDVVLHTSALYSRLMLQKNESLMEIRSKEQTLFGLSDKMDFPTLPVAIATQIGDVLLQIPQVDFDKLCKNKVVGNYVIRILRSNGIINQKNQSAWIKDSVTLTDNGITLLREALWHTLFPHSKTTDFPPAVSDKILKNCAAFHKLMLNPTIFLQFEIAIEVGKDWQLNGGEKIVFDNPLDAQEFAFLCPFLWDGTNDKFQWVLQKYLDWNGKTDRKQFIDMISQDITHKTTRQAKYGLSDVYVWR